MDEKEEEMKEESVCFLVCVFFKAAGELVERRKRRRVSGWMNG